MNKKNFLEVLRVVKDWADSRGYQIGETCYCEGINQECIGIKNEYLSYEELIHLEDRLNEINAFINCIDRSTDEFQIWIF